MHKFQNICIKNQDIYSKVIFRFLPNHLERLNKEKFKKYKSEN